MDNKKLIIGILEDQGLNQNQIADVMAEISQIDMGELDPTRPTTAQSISQQEFELKRQMDAENDWKNKAKLAARILSINLE